MEKKNTNVYFMIILLLVLSAFLIYIFNERQHYKLKINDYTINLEPAITIEEKTRGLMHREYLSKDRGMIFIFDDSDKRTFWMKNTLIPLDMIFVDNENKVVDMKKNFQPCREEPCETYTSSQPARYVIEVNAGLTDELGIETGQVLEIYF
jgi:hypothetical protein